MLTEASRMGQSRGKGQKTEEMPIRAFMAESEAAWGGS